MMFSNTIVITSFGGAKIRIILQSTKCFVHFLIYTLHFGVFGGREIRHFVRQKTVGS